MYQQISKDIRTRILEVEKIVNAGRYEEKVYDKLWIPHYYEFRDDYDDQYHPGWSFPRYTTKLNERKDLNGRSRKSYTRHTVYNEEYDEARAVIISLGPSVSSYEEIDLDSCSYANVVFGFCT